jgi:hypothetical protein
LKRNPGWSCAIWTESQSFLLTEPIPDGIGEDTNKVINTRFNRSSMTIILLSVPVLCKAPDWPYPVNPLGQQ